MKEDFLHYIWQYQEFEKNPLVTAEKEAVQVISVGLHNENAGPDFLNARIKLDGILWSGAVEIHIRASDWYKHKHDQDKAYDTVILHVVWDNDTPAKRSDGTFIPTLALKNRVPLALISRYQQFFQKSFQAGKELWCQYQLPSLQPVIVLSVMETALVQRIERKSAEVLHLLDRNGGDWNETIYQCLAKGFGFKVNADPFLTLSRSVPLSLLLKLGNPLETFEAVFFGQAGLLAPSFQQDYPNQLKQEYHYLSRRFHLHKMKEGLWRFSRLRPANFPTLRIAQLASFVQQHAYDLIFLIQELNVEALVEKLNVRPYVYWQQHYHFEKPSRSKLHGLGKGSIYNLMINVVIPLKFAYARFFHEETLAESTMALLQNIPAEKNKITQRYKASGFPVQSAFDSQALIELHHHYCNRHRCLQCKIGLSIIKNRELSLS